MARLLHRHARGETTSAAGEPSPASPSPSPTSSSAPRLIPKTDGSPSSSSSALRVRFWGVRGSHPVAHTLGSRIGVNTTCLEVRYGRHVLILDAGSGIVALGEELARELASPREADRPTISLLFTHAHHDHLCGLPFFAPLFRADADLNFFGPDQAGMTFENIIAGYMRAPYFPVDFRDLPSRRRLMSVGDGIRLVWLPESNAPRLLHEHGVTPPDALVVDVLYSGLHPRDGTLMYRISSGGQSLVFATDVEVRGQNPEADHRLIAFARSADILIHDAQYSEQDYGGAAPKRGYGHSTPAMAVRVAREAGVGRLVLFHHEPHYDDQAVMELERQARADFPETITAREGLELRLDCLDGMRRRLV